MLTLRDMAETEAFYTAHPGMPAEAFGDGRGALLFGRQKINLHPADGPFPPHARESLPRGDRAG